MGVAYQHTVMQSGVEVWPQHVGKRRLDLKRAVPAHMRTPDMLKLLIESKQLILSCKNSWRVAAAVLIPVPYLPDGVHLHQY